MCTLATVARSRRGSTRASLGRAGDESAVHVGQSLGLHTLTATSSSAGDVARVNLVGAFFNPIVQTLATSTC